MNRHLTAALVAEGERKLARGDFSRSQAETFDVAKLAFPAQLKAIRDPAPSRAVCCGRQSGKTEGAAYDLTDVALKSPGAFQLFIAPNRLWAKRIVWQPLKNARLKPASTIHRSRRVVVMTFAFPVIYQPAAQARAIDYPQSPLLFPYRTNRQ